MAADEPYGDVFLVIDGWATIRQEFDMLEAPITSLAAQGLSYGIHVVVAASRWAEVRPALKDQLGTRIELRLGDPADSEMDRKRARQLVQSPPGRGITRDGHELVIALPRFDEVSADRLRVRYGGRAIGAGLAEGIDENAYMVSDATDGMMSRVASSTRFTPAQMSSLGSGKSGAPLTTQQATAASSSGTTQYFEVKEAVSARATAVEIARLSKVGI
jgi:DNA segregation ATPase FtsK/SpoIIIE-like protein